MSDTTNNTDVVKFSYFDQRYNKIIDNNIISKVGKSVILYFDQSNIPTITRPRIITPSSSNLGEIKIRDGGGNVDIYLVGEKSDPPFYYSIIFDNIKGIGLIYFNGYLSQLLVAPNLTTICYDINKNVLANTPNNYKLISKVVILGNYKPTIDEIKKNPKLGYINPSINPFFLVSADLTKIKTTIQCGIITDNINNSIVYDLTNSCYPSNTQLTWLPNLDSLVVDYNKPYTIYRLYDSNNNVIENDPKNYPLVKKIAVYMNDTPGPFPPPPYASIFSSICFVFILIGGIYYYFFYTPIPENSKGGLFEIGE